MLLCLFVVFFFNDTATTEIYTLSLHDALPICTTTDRSLTVPPSADPPAGSVQVVCHVGTAAHRPLRRVPQCVPRSEEHTSELQSRQYLVCRLLLEKKKNRLYHYIEKSKDTTRT